MPDMINKVLRRYESGKLIDDVRKEKLDSLFDVLKISLKIEQLTSFYNQSEQISTLKELIQWLDDERARNHILVKKEGLNILTEWHFDDSGYFSHTKKKFFKIVGVKVSSAGREINTWSQPILDNAGKGIIGLLIKKVKDRTYFLMQAKADVGNRTIVQLGSTIQFNPGNYIDNDKLRKPFLFDEFVSPKNFLIVMESMQAEEGGRFYKEEHAHKILMLPENFELAIPADYRWFTYNQIRFFLHLGDVVNSSARSILACLL